MPLLAWRVRGDGRHAPAVGYRPDRGGGTAGCGVGRGGHPVPAGDRSNLRGPILVVVVDDVARPQRADPLPARRACRRDDLAAAQHGEANQHAAGDPAGSVDQELLTGVDAERFAENLFGGERRYREGGRGLPAGGGRLGGEQPGRGRSAGAPRSSDPAAAPDGSGPCRRVPRSRPPSPPPAPPRPPPRPAPSAAWRPRPSGRYGRTHPSWPPRLLAPRAVPRRRPAAAFGHLDHLKLAAGPADPRYSHLLSPSFTAPLAVHIHSTPASPEPRM